MVTKATALIDERMVFQNCHRRRGSISDQLAGWSSALRRLTKRLTGRLRVTEIPITTATIAAATARTGRAGPGPTATAEKTPSTKAEALRTGCFYVGALGSRKTHAKRVERLERDGLDAAAIARIAAPIGLDIGASSPPEIAVAILAQIIAALRKRDVGSLKGDSA